MYKEPDIKVFKNSDTEAELVLIEKNMEYYATWDPEILNINEFNENGNINFELQNWIFGRQNKWIDRKARTNRNFLRIISKKTTKGIITFKQRIGNLVGGTFDISVLVLVKKTKNLKINYTSKLLSFLPGKGIIRFCQTWRERTTEKVATKNLSSCPCNIKSAIFDNEFESDPTCSVTKTECHENINANHCYLKNMKKKYVSIYVRSMGSRFF